MASNEYSKEEMKKHEAIAREIIAVLEEKNVTPYESLIILSTLSAALQTYAYNNPDAFTRCSLEDIMKGIQV